MIVNSFGDKFFPWSPQYKLTTETVQAIGAPSYHCHKNQDGDRRWFAWVQVSYPVLAIFFIDPKE